MPDTPERPTRDVVADLRYCAAVQRNLDRRRDILAGVTEIDRLRRLLALAAEHVPEDCPHHDEIAEASR